MSWICRNCETENPDTMEVCEVCNSPAPSAADIIGTWMFHYQEDKEMLLHVRRDGFAKASSGTKYHWQFINGEFVLFLKDLVSYRGRLVKDRIEGTAYGIYKPMGWNWFAIRRDDSFVRASLLSGSWIIENDAPDLEENVILFQPDRVLESSLYGTGKWFIEDGNLVMITANDFVRYEANISNAEIVGKGRNKISNEWNFKLKKQ